MTLGPFPLELRNAVTTGITFLRVHGEGGSYAEAAVGTLELLLAYRPDFILAHHYARLMPALATMEEP